MKKILVLLLFFPSCVNYYCLVTTLSTNTKRVNSHFVYENDTVLIRYNLWANNGQMSFSIYNKLKVPLFIDWKNSSFIANDVSYKYWQDMENATSVSTGIGYNLYSLTGIPVTLHKGTQNTMVQRPERIASIPPQSEIKQVEFSLMPDKNYYNADTGKVFNSDNSPIRFRNYLVLSTSENLTGLFYIDNEFYASKFTFIVDNKFVYVPSNNPANKQYFYFSPDCFYFYIYK